MANIVVKLGKLIQGGFLPIMVKDNFDPFLLCEVVQEAGLPAIEYTLRREDLEKIPQIRKAFPELLLLIGSTLDRAPMVRFLKKKRCFYSLEELFSSGADGFVSILPFQPKTYQKFGKRLILIPGVQTIGEAMEHLALGGHLIKFNLASEQLLKSMDSSTHHLIPVFYTGGATPERIPSLIASGVLVIGAGFDVICGERYKELQGKPDKIYLRERLQLYKERIKEIRGKVGETGYYSGQGKKLLQGTGRYFPCLK